MTLPPSDLVACERCGEAFAEIYDRDGRRVYMEEARLPEEMEAKDAEKWVTDACRRLKQNPLVAMRKVGEE